MEYLEMFFELDFVSIILAIVTILLAWQFLDKLLVWFWEKTGIEFRHIRKRLHFSRAFKNVYGES